VWVIEQGDEDAWRKSAVEQARAVGKQRRYAIGQGTPVTWATTPDRFRQFVDFTRSALLELVP
jgi:hypothetical protein